MASIGSEDGDIGFQIAPMVDVVFVLMLFFMASAGQQVKERELSINLPGGNSTQSGARRQPAAVTPVIIEINSEGYVVINNSQVGAPNDKRLPQLREQLKAMMELGGGEDPVIIRPSPDARHERIMDVLNAAASSNVQKLTFG